MAQSALTAAAYDCSRSFLRFRPARLNHTPRLQLEAACTVTGPDGEARSPVFLGWAEGGVTPPA